MGINYSEVSKRLLEYRQKLELSQLEMGKLLGVEQSHYCKLEAGLKIISYHSLEIFEQQGGDVRYLITGQINKKGIFNKYFDKLKTQKGKLEFIKVSFWIVEQALYLENKVTDFSEKATKILAIAENEIKFSSIWRNIRIVENMTQTEMAEILDINIKRYRRIEQGIVKPDAEILNMLYEELHYSPMLFFDKQQFFLEELNDVWRKILPTTKKRLHPILEATWKVCWESEKI